MTAQTPAARRTRATRRADAVIRWTVTATVAVLAVVSGAISFDHMHLLASVHHQAGWRADAFPISVDGLEIVASLVILAEHREHGRAASVLPWVALAAGTIASLAANVAVGAPHDLIGRAISGWPAVALLVTLKLAASRLTGPGRTARPSPSDRFDWSALVPAASDTGPDRSSGGLADSDSVRGWSGRPGPRSAPLAGDAADRLPAEVVELVAHARRVRNELRTAGVALTRRELARRLRAEGCPVSNDRLSVLLRILRADPPMLPAQHLPN